MNENQTSAPPLDLDLNSVDTSLPLLAKGVYQLQITKVEKKQSSSGIPMINLELSTTGPSKSVEGRDLGPNIKVFHNLNLAPSGKATWEMVTRNVAAVVQATGTSATWNDIMSNPVGVFQGQSCQCSIDIAPAGVDKTGKPYRAKNEIVVFMKPSVN